MFGTDYNNIRAEEARFLNITKQYSEALESLRYSFMKREAMDVDWKCKSAFYRNMPYMDYLLTKNWENVRNECFKRLGGRCIICSSESGIQVHHATYENLGTQSESLDCFPLCHTCHHMVEELKSGFKNRIYFNLDRCKEKDIEELVECSIRSILWIERKVGMQFCRKNIQRISTMILRSLMSNAEIQVDNYGDILSRVVSGLSKRRK